MQPVNVSIDNVTGQIALYGPAAIARLERATEFAGTYGLVDTKVLIAGTDYYTFGDPTGMPGHWYRARVESANAANASQWSEPFLAGALTTYASVDDLVELLPPSNATRNLNLLADLLARATDFMTAECHRDFLRHPQLGGTEIRTYDIATPTRSVRVPAGVVSIVLVEYSTATGGAFVALPASAWALVESQPGSDFYDRLVLTDVSPITGLYVGRGVLRITGAFGWASVPGIIRAGTLALARFFYAAEATPNGQARGRLANVVQDPLPLETAAAIRWATGTDTPTRARGIRSVRMSTREA